MNKIINIIFFSTLSFQLGYASAWTRPKNTLFSTLEFLRESDHFNIILNDKDISSYKTTSYKLYLEYGLFEKITLGGYLKDYNFAYKYLDQSSYLYQVKIKNDYYANLFIIQNLYNKNNNLFSFEYSFYTPIKNSALSKQFNTFDTKDSFEFLILFGKDGELKNIINYFIDSRLGYRIFNNINYDRITFETTLGLRLHPTSSVEFCYEYQDHVKSDNLSNKDNTYNYYANYNSNQIKFSLNYQFLDELSTKFSYYRKFSKQDSSGIIFSFISEFI
ncbi:MAG TPA: hypothetical protein VLL98_01185 [Rickettsiales bacterium]|nr:hypothetical protein [Rickettsiales bacterium]